MKRYDKENRKRIREYQRQWRIENIEKVRDYDKQWHKNFRASNPDKFKKWSKTYYGANKTKLLMDKKIKLQSLKLEVYAAYGGAKCACCGEDHIEFLSIDHINDNGAAHRKKIFGDSRAGSSERMYRWLKRNNYPPGFQILCMNCNCAKHRYGECPHKHDNN